MDINTLITKQTDYFKMISEVVGTPVCVHDGRDHKNFFGAKKTLYYVSKSHERGELVQDRVRFNGQEIILDPNAEWPKVKEAGDKIIKALDNEKIPYVLQFSGRCIRLSIFVKDKIIYYAKSKRIEPQQMCFYLYQYLCHSIGIKWQDFGVPENKDKNHLLGCIGKKNLKTGYYATWIDGILPSRIFETKVEDVKFPDKIEAWKPTDEFLDCAYKFSKEIPNKEVQETLSRTKYPTNEILLKQDYNYNKIRSLKDILKNGIKKPEWNVDKLVTKRGITIIAGIAGSKKTWFGMDMAMCCATGIPFLNHFETTKCDVLYFDEENGEITLPYRFDKLRNGHDLPIDDLGGINISIFNNIKLDTNDTIEVLKKYIEEFKPQMVVFDSMVRCMIGEEDKAKDVSMVFDNLKDVFKDYQELSFVILHHTTKQGRGLMSLRGSGDFAAFADVVLMLNDGSKGFTNVEISKNRHIDLNLLSRFAFEMIDTESMDDGYEATNMRYVAQKVADKTKVDECVESMIDWIANSNIEKFKTKQANEQMGKSAYKPGVITLALDKLIEENKLKRPKQGSYEVIVPTEIVEE